MNKITVRVVVHETDKPISSLQVHFYSLKEQALPRAIKDESLWDKLYEANWTGLTVTRLGSAHTSTDGLINYEYDPSFVKALTKSDALNIWYVVVEPEVAGRKSCPKILHVGCDVRVNAGSHESYFIRIPNERLIRLGLDAEPVPMLSQTFTSPELYTLINEVSQVSLPTQVMEEDGSFAVGFRKRQMKHRAKLKKKNFVYPTRSAFSALLPLKTHEGKSLSENTKITFDKQNKSFAIVRENEPAKSLTFKGLVRIEATNLKSLKQNKPAVQIEESSGNFRLALLKVPDSLRLTDNEPNALYEHYRKNHSSK